MKPYIAASLLSFQRIQHVAEQATSRTRHSQGVSEWIGVGQGCPMAPTVHACNKCFVSAEGKQGAHAKSLFLGRLRFSAAGAPPPPSPLLAALPAGGAACALRAGHCLAPGCCKAAGATLGASISCAARFAQQEAKSLRRLPNHQWCYANALQSSQCAFGCCAAGARALRHFTISS